MKQKLFSNILFLVVANLLVKPLWIFGIDLQVQNLVGTAEYGLYFTVFNFAFLLHIILDMGINQFNNRDIAQSPEKISQQFGVLLFLKSIFAAIYIVSTIVLAFCLDFDGKTWQILMYLMLNQVFLSTILFARSNFTALQWYRWDAFFSILDRTLAIIICGYLLLSATISIEYFALAQTFALGLSAILSLVVVFSKKKIAFPKINFDKSIKLIKSTFPYALVVLLMVLYTRIDVIMLKILLPIVGEYQAGIYAAGYRILEAINMIPFLFASILIPTFARELKSKLDFKPTIQLGFQFLIAISIGFSILIGFYGDQLLASFYKGSTHAWLPSFQILLFTFNAMCLTYIFGGFLTAAGKVGVINKMAVLAIAANIGLNWWLIPEKGAEGAALATIITQSLMAIGQMLYVLHHWKIKIPFIAIGKLSLYGLVLTGIICLLNLTPLTWQINTLLVVLFAVLLTFVLRIIDWKAILSLKN